MISKAAFYRNLSLSPKKVHCLLRLVLFRGVAFLCLLNIVNTIISLPVLQQTQIKISAQNLPPNDPDNSLLELVMEDYLDAPESTSTPPDDADEVLTEVEYLLNRYSFSFKTHNAGKTPYMSAIQSSFINPHLEGVTPPPKQA